MDTNKLKHARDQLVYCLAMIFFGPVYYCCVWMVKRGERTGPDRAAGRRKTAIWGLARTGPRRRLSLASGRLEESYRQASSDDKATKPENENGNSKRQRSLWHRNPSRQKSQPESPFFTRLPPEVRLLIYRYVHSSGRMHVVTAASKMASVPCSKDVVDGVSYRVAGFCECVAHSVTFTTHRRHCVGYELPAAPVSFHNPNARRGAKDALNLLQVSRKVYSEAITVLYQNLTFHMHPISFLGFSISIPDHHLKLIRKLDLGGLPIDYLDSYTHLDYFPSFRKIPQTPNNPRERAKFYTLDHEVHLWTNLREDFSVYHPRPPTTWEVACRQILPRMTGLTELRISLECPLFPVPTGFRISRATERYLLQPLVELSLPNLRVFAVELGWKEGTEEQGWQQYTVCKSLLWLPNVLSWERNGEFRGTGKGGGEAGLERWDSYLRGDGEGVGEMWKDAPFTVARESGMIFSPD